MLNLYALRDVVADESKTVFFMKTDGLAIRSILPVYGSKFPIADLKLYQIGYYDDTTMKVETCPPRLVSWDSYKFPQQNDTPDSTSVTEQK